MKNKVSEAVLGTHGLALGLLVKFKERNVGDKIAEHGRAVDRRFILAATALLKTREEKNVMAWLLKPCRCLDCMNMDSVGLEKQLPRIDMINAEVSFQHLMQQIKCEGYCLP